MTRGALWTKHRQLERVSLADSLNGVPITSKRYDNALQRARRKLREAA